MSVSITRTRPKSLSKMLGLLTVLATLLALTVPAAGASGKGSVKAPVGVWSGIGDHPVETDDYTVIAISDGPAGTQQGYWAEFVVGGCGSMPGAMHGTASMTGADVTISGDLYCVEDGTLLIPDIDFTFTYDATANTLTNAAYPGPFTAKCVDASGATHVGTGGSEIISGTPSHDVIFGKGGNDILIGRAGMDILCGGPGSDSLRGGSDSDVLYGGRGHDLLKGEGGWDYADGGAGRDLIKGNSGNDVLFGASGSDKRRSVSKKGGLFGGSGDDLLFGNGGTDEMSGGGGADFIDGGPGRRDSGHGGPGSDVCTAATEKQRSC